MNNEQRTAGKLLVGFFLKCLTCKATFIRTTPSDCTMQSPGRIIRRDVTAGTQRLVGFVRCPDCLSKNVRLMEIGNDK
ncbi:MAG: hypothetical protein ACYS83_11910 [Planctomycetota bacterium]